MIKKAKKSRRKTKFNSVYCPVGLDLKSKLSGDEYDRYGDRLRFVLHYLYLRGCVFREKKKRGWVVVHSTKWKRALSSHLYRRTLELAEKCGFIEIDEVYCAAGPGNKGRSKRYRLKAKYRRGSFEKVYVTSSQMKKNLRRQFVVPKNDAREWQPVHDHLARNINRVRVGAVASGNSSNARQIINEGGSGIHARVCKFGRFHSVLTRCPKEVRGGWEIDGERLVELDISNCQPLLLASLVCGLVEQNPNLNMHLDKKLHYNTNILYNTDFYIPYVDKNSVPDIIKPLTRKDLPQKDAADLLQLCENGHFYEYFAGKSGRQRDEVKQGLLIELYNTWSKEDRTDRKKKRKRRGKKNRGPRRRKPVFLPIFQRSFPTAYSICRQIKDGDFAKFPQLMQRIESYVIIENVCERLRQEYPDTPVVTVHDAIFTTPSHVETVRQVIREVFGEVLGVLVGFKGDKADPFDDLRIDSSDAH